MATRKPTRKKNRQELPGEAAMTGLYRAAAQDTPPASLDARILAAGQRAVAKPTTHKLFGAPWAIPLSTAAVIVLSVGIVVLLSQQGVLDRHDASITRLAEAPPPETAGSIAVAPLVAPAAVPAPAAEKSKALATKPPIAQGATVPPVARSATMEAKKAEQPVAAPVAAPARRQSVAEAPAGTAREEVRTDTEPAKAAGSMRDTAEVISVQTSGSPGAYRFNVGIRSPDKGCAQYADWWEVVSTDGQLLYRRVLLHSHVDEQPFTRDGGPVPIQPDTVVWVRAHMNPGGYGGAAFMGSVKTGFKLAMPDAGFAAGLARQPPLPDGCAF